MFLLSKLEELGFMKVNDPPKILGVLKNYIKDAPVPTRRGYDYCFQIGGQYFDIGDDLTREFTDRRIENTGLEIIWQDFLKTSSLKRADEILEDGSCIIVELHNRLDTSYKNICHMRGTSGN